MPDHSAYVPTDRTVPTRSRERAAYDRDLVHAILDEAYVCHLGFVRDGAPVVLPTLFGRVGERLYVHGSTGSRPLRTAGQADAGLPVCVTVTHVDGLVLARSAFHHSVNYRSVVVHGIAHQVTDPEEKRAGAGRAGRPRRAGPGRRLPPGERQGAGRHRRAAPGPDEVSAKVRTGGPNDEPEDLSLPHWAGVVPLRKGYGRPSRPTTSPTRSPCPTTSPPGEPGGGRTRCSPRPTDSDRLTRLPPCPPTAGMATAGRTARPSLDGHGLPPRGSAPGLRDTASPATARSSSTVPTTVAAVSRSPSSATASTAALTGSSSMITETVADRTTAAPAKYRP